MVPKRGKNLLRIELYCKAEQLQRPRLSPPGGVYQPKENQRALLSELSAYTPILGGSPIDQPVIVDMMFVFGRIPRKDQREFPTDKKYGDEDNLRKGVNDGLVATNILTDDRLVIGGETFKVFGKEDHVTIKIWSTKA